MKTLSVLNVLQVLLLPLLEAKDPFSIITNRSSKNALVLLAMVVLNDRHF